MSEREEPPVIEIVKLADLVPDVDNANAGTERGRYMLERSLEKLGAGRSLLLDGGKRLVAGNKTAEVAGEIGIEDVIIVRTKGDKLVAVLREDYDLDDPAGPAREMAFVDNRTAQVDLQWEPAAIDRARAAGLDLDDWWHPAELEKLGVAGFETAREAAHRKLAERFVVPPFSVLDARQGYWQARKRAWIELGMRSIDTSRDGALGLDSAAAAQAMYSGRDVNATLANSASEIDPVLCELAYRWFCPPGGLVVNPMAGEAAWGIVAAYLGMRFKGVELRQEQVDANTAVAQHLGLAAQWITGDGQQVRALVGEPCDLVVCCPPYFDLEVYSDDPADLSTMDDYGEFLQVYGKIIAESVALLREDRFAYFVVGDVRDRDGYYRQFVLDTVRAFTEAGCRLYNEAIYVTPAGSLPIRVSSQFPKGRKLGKTHQNVLVFVKGDAGAAVQACGDIEQFAVDHVVAAAFEAEELQQKEREAEQRAQPNADVPSFMKVSAGWASKRLDCTAAGITKRCGGMCCKSPSFWPPMSGPAGQGCAHLGEAGCTLSDEDKPVVCHLAPLKPNKQGTLVMWHRAGQKGSVCFPNWGKGPMIIEALRNNFAHLFGEQQADYVVAEVKAGRDVWVEVPPDVLAAMQREEQWAAANMVPIPRSQFTEVAGG